MKKKKAVIASLFAGAVVGILSTQVDRLLVLQHGYVEGQESVWESKVRIGNPDSPCSIEIPVEALAAMVNTGVIKWHELCEQETINE